MHPLLVALMAYAIASGWESMGHRLLLHAPRKRAMAWHRLGVIGRGLREARFETQLQHSRWMSKAVVDQLEDTNFGLTIHPTIGALVLVSGLPLLLTTLLYLAVCPTWLPLGVVTAHHRHRGLTWLAKRWVLPWIGSVAITSPTTAIPEPTSTCCLVQTQCLLYSPNPGLRPDP
ncbi:MAG: hypothetical protein ACK59A_00615 [Cyanobacteriota bacterium]|jgi:hypothetical protein